MLRDLTTKLVMQMPRQYSDSFATKQISRSKNVPQGNLKTTTQYYND